MHNKKEQKKEKYLPSGLTVLQEEVALSLYGGASVAEVAKCFGIEKHTIYNWQNMIAFRCFTNQLKKDTKEEVCNGVISLYGKALKAVKDCLESDNESVKLKAALAIIGKVEASMVGDTDVKAVLKKKATTSQMSWDFNDFGETEVLDEKEYQRLLKENNLL